MSASLFACGLPRGGPSKDEILNGSVEEDGNSFIVPVDKRISRVTDITPKLGFSSAFTNAALTGADTISAGDVLDITIWENVDNGVLTTTGAPASLAGVQVDAKGNIFIPYAGRIRAAGNSAEAIRRIIVDKLSEQTPDPQVMVARAAGDGATVTITTSKGGAGVFPIESHTRTLGAMIARAGGVGGSPNIVRVKVRRGSRTEEVWYDHLFSNPKMDIALRAGDNILIQEDTRSFTSLGATGQSLVKFTNQRLSAMEAIAQLGGLNSATADPKGIFVLRDEQSNIANSVLNRNDLKGSQRMAYVLDLTSPDGLFTARDFMIRDGDTVYVTEAPYVQWTKILGVITGSLSTAGSISNLSSGL